MGILLFFVIFADKADGSYVLRPNSKMAQISYMSNKNRILCRHEWLQNWRQNEVNP